LIGEISMDQDTLAENAVNLITSMLTGAATSTGTEIGKSLLRLIAGQLSLAGENETLNDLRKHPHDEDIQVTLITTLIDQMRSDPEFRQGVLDLVNKVVTTPASTGFQINTTTATRGGVAVTTQVGLSASSTRR